MVIHTVINVLKGNEYAEDHWFNHDPGTVSDGCLGNEDILFTEHTGRSTDLVSVRSDRTGTVIAGQFCEGTPGKETEKTGGRSG